MMWRKANSALALDDQAQGQSAIMHRIAARKRMITDNFDHPQDRVTTMRIEVENATSTQQTQTNHRTPQEKANHISEHIGKKRQSDTRRNLDSFRNRANEQGTSTVTRTLDRVTKLQMKHLSLLPYRLIHHQYAHPHLMITQPQLTEYRTMPTTVGQQRIHITLDRITSGFRTQLHLGVTIGNRSFTSRPMNKPSHQLSWKHFGSKKTT